MEKFLKRISTHDIRQHVFDDRLTLFGVVCAIKDTIENSHRTAAAVTTNLIVRFNLQHDIY